MMPFIKCFLQLLPILSARMSFFFDLYVRHHYLRLNSPFFRISFKLT